MSIKRDAPSQASDSPPSTDLSDADRLRALLQRAGLSQRAAARLLKVEERLLRHWCAGEGKPPESVFRALSPRLTHAEWLRREVESNEKQIAAMQDGRITGMGYGPGPGDPQALALAIDRLRWQNEQHRALIRMEEAIERMRDAFFALNQQWLPHGNGLPTDESIAEHEAAQAEFHAAKVEMERLARQIPVRERNS